MIVTAHQKGIVLCPVFDYAPINWRIAKQHAQLLLLGQMLIHRTYRDKEPLVNGKVEQHGDLRCIAPDLTKLCVDNIRSGDIPIHNGLIQSIAKFHDDVVDLVGKIRMLDERNDKVMLCAAPMQFAQRDQRKAIKDLEDPLYRFCWLGFA
jgi:hypothetical protein